jgi:glucan 1,3-beta-glucosidase
VAERGGFEPPIAIARHTRFPSVLLQPLGHLSVHILGYHKYVKALRGVNLGGWLVLERWMTPSLFSGSEALDEFTLSRGHSQRIKKHHQTFITEADFAWIAKKGLDAIRIPIGYWIFGDEPPFVGSIDQLDFAFAMSKKYNLQVVISLHGAPGSQNGKRHSGQEGKAGWHWNSRAKTKTLELIERLAKRYSRHSQLWGIEVLNEPSGGLVKNFVRRDKDK